MSHEQEHNGKEGQKDEGEYLIVYVWLIFPQRVSTVLFDDAQMRRRTQAAKPRLRRKWRATIATKTRRRTTNGTIVVLAPVDSHWTRYSMYHNNAYDSGRDDDPKSRRLSRGSTLKITPRRDSKYSEVGLLGRNIGNGTRRSRRWVTR